MKLRQFQQLGFLQEVNRQLLHPMGLAMAFTVENDEVTAVEIWDGRSDPEGYVFTDLTEDECRRSDEIERDYRRALNFRQAQLGYGVQPPHLAKAAPK